MSSSLPNASVVRARGQRAAIFSPEPAQVRTNGVHDEGALDAHGGAVARVDPLDFAGDEAVRDARDAGAAVPLDGRTEQAELAHLGQDGAVKVCGAGSVSIVLVGGDRRGRAGLTLVAVRFSDARCEVLLAVRVRHVPVMCSSQSLVIIRHSVRSPERGDRARGGQPDTHRMDSSSSERSVRTLRGSSHSYGANDGVSARVGKRAESVQVCRPRAEGCAGGGGGVGDALASDAGALASAVMERACTGRATALRARRWIGRRSDMVTVSWTM